MTSSGGQNSITVNQHTGRRFEIRQTGEGRAVNRFSVKVLKLMELRTGAENRVSLIGPFLVKIATW